MKKKIIFALAMGSITTGIISFTLVTINIGFNNSFIATWLRSWGLAYMVVIPVILFVAPRVQHLVDTFFKDNIAKNESKRANN